jgi:SAM-dependent methyltransferase
VYDELAAYYDLVYEDWEAAMRRQGERLSRLLPAGARVLDVAAGIGTQSLPLAAAGYEVVARDLSGGAIDRLRYEAGQRGLVVDAEVADMRHVARGVEGLFDAVIALDNALPHLLTDAEIVEAVRGFRRLLEPDGQLLVSVRDYGAVDRAPRSTHAYGTRSRGGRRYRLSQRWRWTDPERYETTMIVEEEGEERWREVVRASARYYAVPVPRLLDLFAEAGLVAEVEASVDFHQPLIRGRPA